MNPILTDTEWTDEAPVNRYRPVPGATKLLRRYSEDPLYFRLNRYVTNLTTTECEHPEDGWRTARYCFPSDAIQNANVSCTNEAGFWRVTDFKVVKDPYMQDGGTLKPPQPCLRLGTSDSPEFPAQIAEIMVHPACRAMTVRAMKTLVEIQKLPTVRADGDGIHQLEFAAEKMRKQLGELNLSTDGMRLVMNPVKARAIAASPYLRELARPAGSLAEEILYDLTDSSNPNRKYGLPRKLVGVECVVEKSISVARNEYVWPANTVVLLYQHVCPAGMCFSTVQFRFLKYGEDHTDMMFVESKTDANGTHGRIVEDYYVHLACPELSYVLTW